MLATRGQMLTASLFRIQCSATDSISQQSTELISSLYTVITLLYNASVYEISLCIGGEPVTCQQTSVILHFTLFKGKVIRSTEIKESFHLFVIYLILPEMSAGRVAVCVREKNILV